MSYVNPGAYTRSELLVSLLNKNENNLVSIAMGRTRMYELSDQGTHPNIYEESEFIKIMNLPSCEYKKYVCGFKTIDQYRGWFLDTKEYLEKIDDIGRLAIYSIKPNHNKIVPNIAYSKSQSFAKAKDLKLIATMSPSTGFDLNI
jgi:hypothetical protein